MVLSRPASRSRARRPRTRRTRWPLATVALVTAAVVAAACGGEETVTLDLSLQSPDELPFYALLQDDEATGPVDAEGGTEVEIGGENMEVIPIPVEGQPADGDGAGADGSDGEGGVDGAIDDGSDGADGGGGGGSVGGTGGRPPAGGTGGSPSTGEPETSTDDGSASDDSTSGDSTSGDIASDNSASDNSASGDGASGDGADSDEPASNEDGPGDDGNDNSSDGDGSDAATGDESTPEPEATEPGTTTTSTTNPAPTGDEVENVIEPDFAPDRPEAVMINLIDDFSTVDQWLLYEQLIPSRPDCYALDLATAVQYTVEDNDLLALTTNAPGSTLSNHALLGRPVTDRPLPLGPHRYGVKAMIEPGSAIQTGPEFSVQISARMRDGRHLTSVYGVQYVPLSGTWQILVGDADTYGWEVVEQAPLTPGEWYDITLRFDTASENYLTLDVDGPGGFTIEFEGLATVWQDKGIETEASWATVDVENLFTCDNPAVATGTVYYDDLRLITE